MLCLCEEQRVDLHDQLAARQAVLAALGGSPQAIEQVLSYGENHFAREKMPAAPVLPLRDEPHVADWRAYMEPPAIDVLAALQTRLSQLCIPVRQGISRTRAYDEVVRRGQPFQREAFGGALTLERPAQLRLVLHEHPAGALPILVTTHRPDFVTLTQALAYRHEPVPVNASVNAQMIAGLLNWDRVRRYQQHWLAQHGLAAMAQWGQEMQRVAGTEKWRFYDRLMLVCEQPYSGLSATQLGLDMAEAHWQRTSTVLRLEHEFTHYATMRLYGYMGLKLLDETICDWAGITAALGHFAGQWFLKFLGLEDWPQVRQGGRIHTYCQELDQEAFALQCHLMVHVAAGLEALSRTYYVVQERWRFLLALTRMTLELLASESREDYFLRGYQEAAELLAGA
jgi:hypothetical protein